jgi:hypothetical protein
MRAPQLSNFSAKSRAVDRKTDSTVILPIKCSLPLDDLALVYNFFAEYYTCLGRAIGSDLTELWKLPCLSKLFGVIEFSILTPSAVDDLSC